MVVAVDECKVTVVNCLIVSKKIESGERKAQRETTTKGLCQNCELKSQEKIEYSILWNQTSGMKWSGTSF